MQQTKKQAFTLVELIVVIVIISILGTIAFISLQGYSSSARDSKRLSDIQNIKKSLELFSLNTGKYPEPDDFVTVKYDTQDLWYQGTVGNQVTTNLSRNLNKKPTDPLTEKEYIYGRIYSGNEYELLSIYESDLVSFTSPQPSPLRGEGARTIVGANPVFAQASAAHANYPKIDGTYNGVFIKSGEYIIPTPSIVNALNTNLDLSIETTALESQIITGGTNLLGTSTGGLELMSLQVFTGTLDKVGEDDDSHKRDLLDILQQAYTNTSLKNNGIYQEILTTSLTSTGEVIELIDNLVLGKDNYNTSGGSNNGGDDAQLVTYYPGCDTPDIIIGDYTVAACNVGVTVAGITSDSYGEYFQWGRNDGFTYNGGSTTTTTLYTGTSHVAGGIDLSGNATYSGKFIIASSTYSYNWLSKTGESTDPLWGQGPCADGYHVPTQVEWTGLVSAGDGEYWDISGTTIEGTDMQTKLKLPYAGYRNRFSGSFLGGGASGYYGSSSPYGTYGYYLSFGPSSINPSSTTHRANGFSIRCFKN